MNFFQRRKLNKLQKKVEKTHTLTEQDNNKTNIQHEIQAQYLLAKFYEKFRFDKSIPHAEAYEFECYRSMASLGDVKSQYVCGERLLNKGKFWDNWSRHPIYGAAIHKKYAAAFFEESFAYLRLAEDNDYPFAKRLLGLVYINGWGMPKDMNKGYKLVLDSIEQEKAWDRATKIFEELKISSPEFFAALQSYRR